MAGKIDLLQDKTRKWKEHQIGGGKREPRSRLHCPDPKSEQYEMGMKPKNEKQKFAP
jgi:hypothetical protein